jgi:hypothetical protein
MVQDRPVTTGRLSSMAAPLASDRSDLRIDNHGVNALATEYSMNVFNKLRRLM